MTSTRSHFFERNKESPSFRANDDTIIVQCFAFLYFSAVNIEFFLFIFGDLFFRDFVCICDFGVNM